VLMFIPGHLLSLWRSGRLARSLWWFEVFGQASTAERTVRRPRRSPQTIYRQFAKLAGSCRSGGKISLPAQASDELPARSGTPSARSGIVASVT
jgi:hypothetical protein